MLLVPTAPNNKVQDRANDIYEADKNPYNAIASAIVIVLEDMHYGGYE